MQPREPRKGFRAVAVAVVASMRWVASFMFALVVDWIRLVIFTLKGRLVVIGRCLQECARYTWWWEQSLS